MFPSMDNCVFVCFVNEDRKHRSLRNVKTQFEKCKEPPPTTDVRTNCCLGSSLRCWIWSYAVFEKHIVSNANVFFVGDLWHLGTQYQHARRRLALGKCLSWCSLLRVGKRCYPARACHSQLYAVPSWANWFKLRINRLRGVKTHIFLKMFWDQNKAVVFFPIFRALKVTFRGACGFPPFGNRKSTPRWSPEVDLSSAFGDHYKDVLHVRTWAMSTRAALGGWSRGIVGASNIK